MNDTPEQPTSPAPSTTPAATTPEPSLLGAAPVDPAAPQEVLPEGEGAPAEPAPAAPAPLTAEDIQLPEGLEADPELINGFVETLNSDMPPQERAAALLELHNNILTASAKQAEELWQNQQEAWRKEALALPDIGGDKLPQTLGEVAKVVDRYGGEEVRQALDLTGAGNHPAIIQLFAKIAADINEAPPVSGTPPTATPKSRAERMFGAT